MNYVAAAICPAVIVVIGLVIFAVARGVWHDIAVHRRAKQLKIRLPVAQWSIQEQDELFGRK